jgi:hypothetical protein
MLEWDLMAGWLAMHRLARPVAMESVRMQH